MNAWIPTVISSLALLVSIVAFIKNRRSTRLAYLSQMVARILELNLKYPQFNDSAFTSRYPAVGDDIKAEYDVYATMVWNCIGLIAVEYGRRAEQCPFTGTIEYWSALHGQWIKDGDRRRFYSSVFVQLPGLSAGYHFDSELFPEVHRRQISNRRWRRIYYATACPLLAPFSKKHRELWRGFVRAGR